MPRQQQGALRRETAAEITKDYSKRLQAKHRPNTKDSDYSDTLSEKLVSSSESYHPAGAKRMRADENAAIDENPENN